MGIADYIKTRLLNNRVEQYNTNRSYWGEDERQPRIDGINTGLDLPDALPPVINKTIANARYAVKLDGYTSGILKNRIEQIRKERGIRQEEFAKSMGVSRQTISSLENGRYNPSILLAHKIAKYFGMSIEEVFIFDEEEHS